MAKDIKTVQQFLQEELEQRQNGGEASYVQSAKDALEAFERIVGFLDDEGYNEDH